MIPKLPTLPTILSDRVTAQECADAKVNADFVGLGTKAAEALVQDITAALQQELTAQQLGEAIHVVAALAPEIEVCSPGKKMARTQMRVWVQKHLRVNQGGLCPLCLQPIDLKIKGEGVVDHDHDTGRIRGVLHRSCNAAEGKISNAAARWGAKSSRYPDIVAYLKRVAAYLEGEPTPYIYPFHKTADEKRVDRNKRVRELRAQKAARIKLQEK